MAHESLYVETTGKQSTKKDATQLIQAKAQPSRPEHASLEPRHDEEGINIVKRADLTTDTDQDIGQSALIDRHGAR